MPESSGSIVEIHNSLKASLGRGHSDLDQDVVAASKRVLLETITFIPASAPYTMQLDALKAKYISLNPAPLRWDGDKPLQQQKETSSQSVSGQASSERSEDGLPTPKIILYPEEKVKMEWTRMTRIGAGLVNMGNTCFFNSTLQCLTYTAPLVNYCLSNDHRSKCKKKDFCMMCEIQSHIKSSLDFGGRSIKPHSMLQKLRCIAKHMKWGRQEDAHEFLRFVVDHLQQSCLNGESKLDQLSKDTTVINQIFGGYLRSQVTCLRCQAKSNTFDPFMDLSLDIKGVNTVEEALAKFVKPETLENDNAYKCPKCKHKVKAQKRFTIQKAPNVLTLQLNRFDFHRHLSGKINRFIKYPEKINLRNFMSQRQGEPILYHLYGVLVHSGHSSEHGHYYSYVKSPSKTWYCMNDSIVHQAAYNNVFNADAYVLFYARINKPVSSSSSGSSASPGSTSTSQTPKVPLISTSSQYKPVTSPLNGLQGKPNSDLGTPLKRQDTHSASSASEPKLVAHTSSVSSAPKIVAHTSSANNAPKIVSHTSSASSALPGVYNKISFPILTAAQKKLVQQEDGKRIVLQIKHGNSTTMEKSPDGQSKVVNRGSSQPMGLVPYNSDSDSELETQSAGLFNKDGAKPVDALGEGQHMNCGTSHVDLRPMTAMGDAPAHRAHSSSSHSSTSGPVAPKEAPPKHSSVLPLKGSLKNISQPTTPHRAEKNVLDTVESSATPHRAVKHVPVTVELPAINLPPAVPSKFRSTGGNWFIQSQDCVASPKSSCSSGNSINSTTEWTVESKDKVSKHPGGELVPKCTEGISNGKKHTREQIDQKVEIQPSFGNRWDSRHSAKDDSGHRTKGDYKHSTKEDLKYDFKDDSEHSSRNDLWHNAKDSSKHKDDVRQSVKDDSGHSARDDSEHSAREDSGHSARDDSGQSTRNDSGHSARDDSGHSSLSSGSKKAKKHKKKIKSSEDDEVRRKEHLKKKKKHKEKKRKKEKERKDVHEGSKGKKKKQPQSSSSFSTSESEDGYEWVEKTKETTGVIKSKTGPVTVQSWNDYIKDDVAPKKESAKIKSVWDGSRPSSLRADLDGTSISLGTNVLSWDGGKNHIDEDTKANKKRKFSDVYNEEIDAGKVKKVKKNYESSAYSKGYNPFQVYQSDKYQDKKRDSGDWKQDHSYYQNHHHDNKWKTYSSYPS